MSTGLESVGFVLVFLAIDNVSRFSLSSLDSFLSEAGVPTLFFSLSWSSPRNVRIIISGS
jgi:hypothetical protein